MKQTLLSILLMLLPLTANAETVEINGIYYNLVGKSKQAEVTKKLSGYYSGTIEIPEKVTYDGAEYSVTSIGDYAFADCSSLTSVTIPSSVTSIGMCTFQVCSSLTSVTIPNSVKSIGLCAFWECSSLTSISIPDGVRSIGEQTFDGCSSLTSVTIPNSVNTIGYCAFRGCSSLISVTIPNNVDRIGEQTFKGCSSLTSVTIPNNVDRIATQAFKGCSSLTSITIGSGVEDIYEYAFAQCTKLTDVYCLAESVPSTKSNAFEDSYIESATLHVPASAINSYKAKTPWSYFKDIVKNGKPEFTLTYLVDGEVYKTYSIEEGASITPEPTPTKEGYSFSGWSDIPQTMPDHDVTVTGAFTANKYKLTYVVDGETYKTYDVEYGATITPEAVPTKNGCTFSGWSDIPQTMPAHDVTVTGTFTFIGFAYGVEINGIYYNLNGDTKQAEVTMNPNNYSGKVDIPATVTYNNVEFSVMIIGLNAFFGCSSLTNITIPNSITSIGNNAFSGCNGLTSVTIPNSVTSIGEGAFQYCNSLTSITIPNSVTSIGRWTFEKCSSLTSIAIPSSVTSIGGSAFSECSSLISVTIPNRVTSIGGNAFGNCSSLTSITIPSSVTSIGEGAFQYCTSMTSITIPNGVTSIGKWTFQGCKSLNFFSIPNSVTSIEENAFSFCSSLTSITIPNSVTSIGYCAFDYCRALTSVTIGNGIESIGEKAFAFCQKITDVYCSATNVPNTASDAFDRSYLEYITLHVPVSAINSYKSTEPWSSFKKVIGIGASYTLTYKVDGQVYKSYELAVGEDITPEAEPTKEGYTFSGWSDIPQTMPDHDVTVTGTFTANKYKLTYVVDGETYKSYDVEYGASITPEAEPTKDGCTFSGWSEIPQTMPAHDVTVTGTFNVSKYKLIYKVDGEVYKTYELKYGSTITPEAEPTKEGHTFSGWSDIPETMPAHDVTVTGTFTVNKYKLTYLVDDKEYKSYEVEYGASITQEAEPTKKGHTFSGWSDIPNTMPARDVTVTGSFTINKYKLIYMVDGDVYKSYDIRYGSTITPEAEPTKNGYKFSGWSDIPEEMPDYDVTVYGYFEKVYDVGDIVSLVNIIMNLTNASSEDISAYDMNHDNDLDIGDMILVIKEILRSQQTRVRDHEVEGTTRSADPYVDLAQFTAAQFTVSVPTECAVEDIRLTGNNRNSHAVVWEQIDAGLYAVVIYSDSNLKFSPENGTILEVALSDKDCTEIATGNVILATPEGERVWLNSLPAYAATTGIANIRSTEAFDVYDLSGRKVRSQCHSLEGISSGVYIINGKKTVIK